MVNEGEGCGITNLPFLLELINLDYVKMNDAALN